MEEEFTRRSAGERLPGGFRLESLIGRGGMGEVWRAFDERLQRPVAVKLLGADMAQGYASRLESEARAIARLNHRAIVSIYDIGRDPRGEPFLVMELLEGGDLAERLITHGPVAPARVVRWLLELLEALQLCHAAGVVHRDIKPSNLFLATNVGREPQVKLLDFGVARIGDRSSGMTAGVIGTPAYMAPEQLHLGAAVSPATDVWALGITAYELLAGQLPFTAPDPEQLFALIREGALPYPRFAGLDGRLFGILATATRKAPADRFSSAQAMRDALEAWADTAENVTSGVRFRRSEASGTLETLPGNTPRRGPESAVRTGPTHNMRVPLPPRALPSDDERPSLDHAILGAFKKNKDR